MSMLTFPEDGNMDIMILWSQFYHVQDILSCILDAQLPGVANYRLILHLEQLKANALLCQVQRKK